jgi:hypothetical protein
MAVGSVRIEAGLLQQLAKLAESLIAFGGRGDSTVRSDHDVRGKYTDLIRARHFVFSG